jgi:hypothetical protein
VETKDNKSSIEKRKQSFKDYYKKYVSNNPRPLEPWKTADQLKDKMNIGRYFWDSFRSDYGLPIINLLSQGRSGEEENPKGGRLVGFEYDVMVWQRWYFEKGRLIH